MLCACTSSHIHAFTSELLNLRGAADSTYREKGKGGRGRLKKRTGDDEEITAGKGKGRECAIENEGYIRPDYSKMRPSSIFIDYRKIQAIRNPNESLTTS